MEKQEVIDELTTLNRLNKVVIEAKFKSLQKGNLKEAGALVNAIGTSGNLLKSIAIIKKYMDSDA